jgi:ascorbate-specific PTS system EIIC-type component UlaA
MNEDGPDIGTIIAAIFLILFGLCVSLVGGACTVIWIGMMISEPGESMGVVLLLISAAVLAAGITAIVIGVRMLIKRRQDQPEFGSVEPRADRNASPAGDEGLNKPDEME